MWGKTLISREKEEKKPKYAVSGKVIMVPTNDILPNPDQPRREYSYQKLLELSQSMVENGLLHPLTITFREGRPMLVAGERRLRAAKIAGMQEIPCIARETDDRQRALLALVENLQREEMNCFEEAEGYRRLIESYGLTQEEAAYRLGCAQSTVANKLRLLRLPPAERRRMIDAGLTERHARALLRLHNEEAQMQLVERIREENLSVKATEDIVESELKKLYGELPPEAGSNVIHMKCNYQIYLNTIKKSLEKINSLGVQTTFDYADQGDCYEVRIKIMK